ncbi:putative poly(ADP-ribose) glycohydrolase [Trypanosoma vivax]|nr:putative poly(ADP-ribose) glycohydrolase [Trypanosoma vivax]
MHARQVVATTHTALRQTTICDYFSTLGSAENGPGGFVMFPWTETHSVDGNGAHTRWKFISAALVEDACRNTESLQLLLRVLCACRPVTQLPASPQFNLICHVIDTMMSAGEKESFFSTTVPWIKHSVLRGPSLFPCSLQLLVRGKNDQISLSRPEVTTLLSCGFFSVFCVNPPMFELSAPVPRGRQRTLNFAELFSRTQPGRMESQCAKIRCLLQYFIYWSHRLEDNGTHLMIYRSCLLRFPQFCNSTMPMQSIYLSHEGKIEENSGCLQVDFANKFIGGGVLQSGCLQEEIRFVTCPELLIACLVCEELMDNESVFICGAEQYSETSGYASSFRFVCARHQRPSGVGNMFVAKGESEHHERRLKSAVLISDNSAKVSTWAGDLCVVAMDAIDFSSVPELQYLQENVERETRKAFVAFKGVCSGPFHPPRGGPVATGNWGCGAFCGDPQLKLLIQWCAASEAGRPLLYSTYGNSELCHSFERIRTKLYHERWTVGDVFTHLLHCCSQLLSTGGRLFDYFLATPLGATRE